MTGRPLINLPEDVEAMRFERQRRVNFQASLDASWHRFQRRCGICDEKIEEGDVTATVDDERCHARCVEEIE